MSQSEDRRARAVSFGAVAAEYERGRPPYPPRALDWLLPPGAARVVDLGAGTGKLTRQLRDRGLEVIAVEPSAGMRGQLRQAVPGVPVVAGTGEQIPLASRCADAVLAAQAWHWVDPARAVPEVARVLRPGGCLGLLWNLRDERVGWVARLSEIMHVWDAGDEDSDAPVVGPPFGPVERLDVEWVFRLPAPALADYAASRSYVISLPEAKRRAVIAAVRDFAATDPALAGAGEVALPQVTRCSRATLAPAPG